MTSARARMALLLMSEERHGWVMRQRAGQKEAELDAAYAAFKGAR